MSRFQIPNEGFLTIPEGHDTTTLRLCVGCKPVAVYATPAPPSSIASAIASGAPRLLETPRPPTRGSAVTCSHAPRKQNLHLVHHCRSQGLPNRISTISSFSAQSEIYSWREVVPDHRPDEVKSRLIFPGEPGADALCLGFVLRLFLGAQSVHFFVCCCLHDVLLLDRSPICHQRHRWLCRRITATISHEQGVHAAGNDYDRKAQEWRT